jgi:acyl-coenzyme A synthetase/AMP-(fatty) acid ligase
MASLDLRPRAAHAGACAVLEDDLRLVALLPAAGGGALAGTDADAWILFTSGFTGAPDGVAVTHRAAAAFADAEAQLWAVTPKDRPYRRPRHHDHSTETTP